MCERNRFFPRNFYRVYSGPCVEPCVKNIPMVNYKCVCVRTGVRVLYDSKLWMHRAAGGAMGPRRTSEHVAQGVDLQMMKLTKQKGSLYVILKNFKRKWVKRESASWRGHVYWHKSKGRISYSNILRIFSCLPDFTTQRASCKRSPSVLSSNKALSTCVTTLISGNLKTKTKCVKEEML